ncbi:nitrate/nitrite transporter [Sphingomonas lycopersici]|uniref:MFS transporter n=1 Tax=Sphingomonas lycopersici TaxID=2951807 RepID=A0AA41ZEH8_9SPHN|nr:MFS transporter [Sphingomonas lycopersici]MCW6537616.1 MFS transporter [Sphingomonas lycopersici]
MATFWDETADGKSSGFWQSGHRPTLIAALLYFDLAFMVWVLLGPLAPDIARSLGLTPAEKGLMVAVPTLAGAVLRVVNGVLVDRIGPKRAGTLSQAIVILGLFIAWAVGVTSFAGTLALGVVLGFAGASFAIALPLASRWYPPEHQGKAMGLAGMGNSGTVLAALFAPALAGLYGWNAVLGLCCIPLSIVLVLYLLLAKDPPSQPAPRTFRQYLGPLANVDAWTLMGFYTVTFGGFVGLAASLPIYFTDRFGMTPIHAGYATAACVFAGSLVRPIGGTLADARGGASVLGIVLLVVAAALMGVSIAAGEGAVLACFIIAMLALGLGNGAVFQLVPLRFADEIGVMTGLVGMAGGVGGFCFATSLGLSRQLTGGFAPALVTFAALALLALGVLVLVTGRWRATWETAEGVRI